MEFYNLTPRLISMSMKFQLKKRPQLKFACSIIFNVFTHSQAYAFHYLQSGLKGTLNGNQIEFKAIESSFAVSTSMQVMVFEAQNELENK